MRRSVLVSVIPILPILPISIGLVFQIEMVFGTTIYSNSTLLSDEYYEDTAKLPEQAKMYQQFENQSELEPMKEINGDVYIIAPISPDPQKYNSPLGPVLSQVQIGFSGKNLTGYEFIPGDFFIPRETSMWWSSDLKIPISPTETLVKDFLLSTQVDRIIEVPEWDQTMYFSSGTLAIRDSMWNVNVNYNKANDNSTAELTIGSYCKYCQPIPN
jgi:hypothetical protein